MSRFFEIISHRGTRQFADSDLPLTIGSGQDAQIPLPEGAEAAAWVADSRGYLFLQADETGVPVYHNDKQVQGSTWIKSGDTTRISQTIISWSIQGDRVEVTMQPAAKTPQPPPSREPHIQPPPAAALPRVDTVTPPPRRKHLWLPILLAFSLLAITALFLLTAHRLELEIQPTPDSLSVSGFPPVLQMGESFLALSGTYTLHAEKAGYRPLSEQIIVMTGSSSHSFTLEKLPGIVTITSTPVSGARVFIDDSPMGDTPLNNAEISSGEHLLRLEKERYLPLEMQLSVAGGGEQQSVETSLQPGWGTITLTSDPGGAVVSRDEQVLVGTTPLTVELMAGNVLLTFSKMGFTTVATELAVVAGQPLSPATIQLQPAPAKVTLRSTPGGAMVTINTTFVGTTPVTLSLPSNEEQNISLQLSGFKTTALKRTFIANAIAEIPVTLQPLYGTILLSTDPVEATLFIDGKRYGPATGKHRLPARKHTLTVEAEGFETATKNIHPKEGISQQLEIRLQKKGTIPAQSAARQSNNTGEFIRLGPATVQMGANRREAGRRANEQQRTVQLTHPFVLAVRPVTNQEFRRFNAAHRSGVVGGQTLDGDKQPVVNVSWEDAARYCNWFSVQNGLPEFYTKQGKTMTAVSPINTGYRLPTEAEWALAARMAGRQQLARYPWTGKFPPTAAVGNFADESARSIVPIVLHGYNDGFPVTSPVGSFAKNLGGFFDLGGNISQWCHDWYTPYAGFDGQKKQIDPLGPVSGSHHVTRGASWRDATITTLRLSYRGYSKNAKDDIGFRVARYVQ